MKYELESVKERLRKARLERGITKKEMAEMTGMSLKGIYNLENGKCRPRLDTLALICETLDLSIDELLKGGEQK